MENEECHNETLFDADIFSKSLQNAEATLPEACIAVFTMLGRSAA